MTRWQKFRLVLFELWWCDIKPFPSKIKRCVWNRRVLLWWYRLWIRKDEFHRSTEIDTDAMIEMDKQEKMHYLSDLFKRRKVAHQRGLV